MRLKNKLLVNLEANNEKFGRIANEWIGAIKRGCHNLFQALKLEISPLSSRYTDKPLRMIEFIQELQFGYAEVN